MKNEGSFITDAKLTNRVEDFFDLSQKRFRVVYSAVMKE